MSNYGQTIDERYAGNAAATLNGSERLPCSQGGAGKVLTVTQILAFVNASIVPLTETGSVWITVTEDDINGDGTVLTREEFEGHTVELLIIDSNSVLPGNYSFNSSTGEFTFSNGVTVGVGTKVYFQWRDAAPAAMAGAFNLTVADADINDAGTVLQHADFVDKQVELLMIDGQPRAPYDEDSETGYYTFNSTTGTYTFYNGQTVGIGAVIYHQWRNTL